MSNIIIETESDEIEAKVLGQRVSAPSSYTPDILVAVPRINNRRPYEITNEDFVGYDYWTAYECTFLLESGSPVYLALRIEYPSDSEFIVESKSLKLYFNSFNNSKISGLKAEAISTFIETTKKDLSDLLKTDVRVSVFDLDYSYYPYEDFDDINLWIDTSEVEITEYNENKDLLKEGKWKAFSIYIEGLLSNCQVTGQPDHATLLIDFDGDIGVDLESLYRYVISHRKENRFHEATLETIFKHVKDKYNPEKLTILALYTRRGGISISPLRSLSNDCHNWIRYRSFFD